MIKSFMRMRSVDTGYDANRVTRMTVDLTSVRYRDAATLVTVLAALLLVALAAGYLRARRASRVKVLTALAQE